MSADIEKKFVNKYIDPDYVTNIDVLRYKCSCNYYFSKNSFIHDIDTLFSNISQGLMHFLTPNYNKKFLFLYQKYLSVIYEQMIKLVLKSEIEQIYSTDIREMLSLNNLPKSNIKSESLPVKKDYEMIDDFCHVNPEETIPKTLTTIKPSCKGKCCQKYQQLGPLCLDTSFWKSECCDRKKNIECDPEFCGCKLEQCKNLSLYAKKYKKLNEDVEERYTWGIDLFTYRNLLNLFPENFTCDNELIRNFIEKTLMIALSKLGKYGNKISKGCEYIANNSEYYRQLDIDFAEHLLSIYSSVEVCEKEINNAYSKGIGIFCINGSGIKQNELIAPYLGEVYSPHLWFEKQDIIKRKKLDKNLPDFYNIMLERFKNDSAGYDLLMVDPNSKGNFASRMSHSCDPNCNTVLMVSGGKYTIGMFATKDIRHDEELTFDYNSVTEKEKEFYDAICLCSSFNCRGHYLILSNSMIYTEIINKFHTFLHRNAILIRACSLGDKPLTEKESAILDKYSIKSSVIGNTPIWLKRWSALILAFVDAEKELLPIILYKAERQEEFKPIKKKEKKKEKKPKKSDKKKEKKKNSKKQVYITYNFIEDYVWEKKSYSSKTRGKKEEEEDAKIDNENNLEEVPKKEETIKVEEEKQEEKQEDKQEDPQNQVNSNETILDSSDDMGIERPGLILQQHLQNETLQPKKEESIQNGLPPIEINEEELILPEDLTDTDLPEISLESNDFSFLSELNLQLDQNYDAALLDTIKFQVAGITEQRIQNLIITLDKIKHIISLIHSNEPPLRVLTEEETYFLQWKALRQSLLENFQKISTNPIVTSNQGLSFLFTKIIQKLSFNPLPFISKNISYDKVNEKVRKIFLEISMLIKQCKVYDSTRNLIFYEGLSDMLYLYARTKLHFTPNQNVSGQFLSQKIQIRKRDVDTSCLPEEFFCSPLDTVIAEGQKEYENHYIWGQLVGWYKQTVDKPNASLSTERRGNLSYPELDSFFVKEKNEKIFNYPCGGRENFYEKLKENGSMTWPIGNDWSFKNKNKVYGTVQFDAVYFENYYLDKIKEYVSGVLKKIL